MAEKPYRALAPLFVASGARAHNVGDVVPDENVEANGWSDLVAREGSKAVTDAVKADTAAPAKG